MASKDDLSPYARTAVMSDPKMRKKLLSKLAENVLQWEQLWAKRHVMSRDYPELDIIFPMIEKERKEAEKLFNELQSYK